MPTAASTDVQDVIDPAASAPAVGVPGKRQKPHLFVTLGLIAAIVFGAWFVSGRAGLADLGKGGVNEHLLPKVGQVAPDVTLTDPLGESTVTLSSFRGQAIWLNFWGSWCVPCRSEMPDIQAAWQEVQDKGIVLLAVSLDEDPLAAAYFAYQSNVTFRILSDQFRTATSAAYPIANFPTHIFIDKDGVVRHVVLTEMTTEDAVHYAEQTIDGV